MKHFFLFSILLFPLYLYGEAASPTPPPTAAASPTPPQRNPSSSSNVNTAPLNVGSGAGGNFSLMDDYGKSQSGTTNYDKDTPVEALEAQKEKIRKQEEDQQAQQKKTSSPALTTKNLEPVENDSLPSAQYWQHRKQARYHERKQERLQRKEEERTLQVPSF